MFWDFDPSGVDPMNELWGFSDFAFVSNFQDVIETIVINGSPTPSGNRSIGGIADQPEP